MSPVTRCSSGTPGGRSGVRQRCEQGYVLFLTVVLLVPLMGVAALGVDLGVWYVQASENQRAADAAALAGAVWMPDEAAATAAIYESLTRNGYTPWVDSTVTIDFLGSNSVKVGVSTKSEMAFTGLFIDEFSITRSAIGRYVPPTALGSPTNSLGEPGLWLAISGDCSVRENGDLNAARYLAGYPGGSYPPASCGGGYPNPEYTGEYILAVDVPQPLATNLTVQVYDGTYNPSAAKTTDLELRPPSNFHTTFTLYDNDGAPFDLSSATVLSTTTFASRDAATDSVWANIGTIPTPTPGVYYLKVSTNGSGGTNSFGSNGFAVRAFEGATPTACSTRPSDADYSPTCPQVFAVEDLPLYASLSSGSSEFFLSEIPATHKGKEMEISLFDVGEGAERIEIIDPAGNSTPFTWTTDCSITSPGNPPGCSGVSESWINPADSMLRPHTLDVSGTGNQVYADTLGNGLWNDRTVVVTVDIPPDYDTAYTGRWWKVRYYFGSDITDRTTWSVRVIGDPVRLDG